MGHSQNAASICSCQEPRQSTHTIGTRNVTLYIWEPSRCKNYVFFVQLLPHLRSGLLIFNRIAQELATVDCGMLFWSAWEDLDLADMMFSQWLPEVVEIVQALPLPLCYTLVVDMVTFPMIW